MNGEPFYDEYGLAYVLAPQVPWWRRKPIWLERAIEAHKVRRRRIRVRKLARKGTRLDALRAVCE